MDTRARLTSGTRSLACQRVSSWGCALAAALVAFPAALGADEPPLQKVARLAPDQHLGPEPRAKVRRIVTLAPSLTDLVLALGAGERIVGVTRFDDDPRVAAVPRVGGYNDPEPEAVLRLKPDLVLAQPAPENRGPVEALARLGVPIDAFKLGTLAQIELALRGVGARLGLSAKADELAKQMSAHRAAVRKAAPGKGVRALLVFGLDPLVVAGQGGFAGELLEDTGAVNALDDPRAFIRLSAEAAVASRPDRIVLCGVDAPVGRPALPGLGGVPTTSLQGTALLHPGPRLGEALDAIALALAPIHPIAPSGKAK
jgi:iron complex transport system substrate-binding protein